MRRGDWQRCRGSSVPFGGFFKEFVVDFTATGKTVASINHTLRGHQIFGGKDLSAEFPEMGQSALYCVTEIHAEADIERLTMAVAEAVAMTRLREVHTASWDEPLVMEMGRPGRRGMFFPPVEPGIAEAVGAAEDLIPAAMRRADPPALPELSEPEVQRHYLRLSQETQGMMHISLFGTCTMKYHPPVAEQAARRWLAELHPLQPEDTLQGVLAAVHGFDLILRELSGMDQFVFQAGGGADAAYTHAVVTRAWLAAKGELGQRDEIVTSIQAHPCNAATAAAAGFKVVTLMLEEDGYPSVDALKAAVSDRTAALMIGNPDDMGIYNPHIKEWVRIVHEAGGLAFYDHANFNGVMGRIRAAELGFDACMFMLHKTFGAPKGGGGPAVGAYGCSKELAPFLPGPVVVEEAGRYRLDHDRPQGAGKVREFWGNVPQVIKAYAWAIGMGGDGLKEAADLSVLANNYMDAKLARIPGLAISHPNDRRPRMEMTRWGLGPLKEATGVGTVDVANRLADYGVDPWWMSHEPWVVPEPFTPEAGEMYGQEDLDYWVAVVERICEEARKNPDLVRTAPHRQSIAQIDGSGLDDPARWAMTWRAYRRKVAEREAETATRPLLELTAPTARVPPALRLRACSRGRWRGCGSAQARGPAGRVPRAAGGRWLRGLRRAGSGRSPRPSCRTAGSRGCAGSARGR